MLQRQSAASAPTAALLTASFSPFPVASDSVLVFMPGLLQQLPSCLPAASFSHPPVLRVIPRGDANIPPPCLVITDSSVCRLLCADSLPLGWLL